MTSKKPSESLVGTTISDFQIVRYINSGAFGDVYEAKSPDGERVAFKVPVTTDGRSGDKLLADELKVYRDLNRKRVAGIVQVGELVYKNHPIMVMPLLGDSLEKIVQKTKGKRPGLRLKMIILLAIRLLEVIESLHSAGYIHRDIKPDNWMLDPKGSQLYCIDLGLAKKIHPVAKRTGKFCGTPRFASTTAHRCREQSRKDDLESIGYLLVYLYKGFLPWQKIKHTDKKIRYKMILESKESTTSEKLFERMPRQFYVYFKYVKSLDHDEIPVYSSLIKMFIDLLETRGYANSEFDWNLG
jgi:serine/threonine protein kinase